MLNAKSHAPPQIVPMIVDAGGVRLAARRHGAGPPVVCLHATGHGARDFDALAQRLGDAHDFIAIDWPGQGDSPPDVTPPSAARYGEILAAAIDALGLDRVILLGNSIGGAAAVIYAAAHPARVRGLVLCNAGGLFSVNGFVRWYCGGLARRFARGAAGDRGFPAWYAKYYRKLLPLEAAAWRRAEIVADGPSNAAILAQAWTSFARPEADIRRLVPNLPMPVLYAWGKRDSALPWFIAKAAALKAPRAEVALFDAGHSAFLERPEAFDASFRAFTQAL